MLTEQQFRQAINNLKRQEQKTNEILDQLKPVFGNSCFEGGMFNLIYYAKDVSIYILEDVMGDKKSQWINWFIFENEFGRNDLSIVVDGVESKIKTASDLYRVLAS